MPTSPRTTSNNRQRRLTAYRVGNSILLLAILAGVGVMLFRPSAAPQPITVTQATKIERAAAFLQDVGFNDPIYLGITPGAEGEYPTFQATAIGGEPIKLWIRTKPNEGWEIQPVGLFENVASADDLARVAQQAVLDWQNMPPDIKPRTDGAYGEYETRKDNYALLAKYNPDESYWSTPLDETTGWLRK